MSKDIRLIRCKTPHDIIVVDSQDTAIALSEIKTGCGHPHQIIVSDFPDRVNFKTSEDKNENLRR